MFEKYNLTRKRYENDIVFDIKKTFEGIFEDNFPVTDYNMFFRNGRVNLNGECYYGTSYPLTDFARNNLFYIQTFSYWEADTFFLTERSNVPSFLLSYTYEGEGYLEYDGRVYQLNKGEGFWIDCRKPHLYRTKKKIWKHTEFHIWGSYLEYLYDRFRENGEVIFRERGSSYFRQESEKLVLLQESVILYRELQISNQIENLLMLILRNTEGYEKSINKIPENLEYLIKYMEKHYMEPLSLDFLSKFSNISKYHLCRLFRKYLEFSPNEYLIWLRIENAKNMLVNTTMSANKIGNMVGIPDENYFYRLFKSRTGYSPKEYRNIMC